MSYKIVIYSIMLIFVVKKFLFVSSECFLELFFASCIMLSEENNIFVLCRMRFNHIWELHIFDV